jgi:hypothetical protein
MLRVCCDQPCLSWVASLLALSGFAVWCGYTPTGCMISQVTARYCALMQCAKHCVFGLARHMTVVNPQHGSPATCLWGRVQSRQTCVTLSYSVGKGHSRLTIVLGAATTWVLTTTAEHTALQPDGGIACTHAGHRIKPITIKGSDFRARIVHCFQQQLTHVQPGCTLYIRCTGPQYTGVWHTSRHGTAWYPKVFESSQRHKVTNCKLAKSM